MSEHNSLFITMWYCVYNVSTNEFRFSGAAHPPIILIHPNGKAERIKSQNTIVGYDQEMVFNSNSVRIEKDSVAYLYTDGAYEIELQGGNTMKVDDLVQFLYHHENEDSSEIEDLYQHLKQLNGGHEKLDDDFTMLKVNFK